MSGEESALGGPGVWGKMNTEREVPRVLGCPQKALHLQGRLLKWQKGFCKTKVLCTEGERKVGLPATEPRSEGQRTGCSLVLAAAVEGVFVKARHGRPQVKRGPDPSGSWGKKKERQGRSDRCRGAIPKKEKGGAFIRVLVIRRPQGKSPGRGRGFSKGKGHKKGMEKIYEKKTHKTELAVGRWGQHCRKTPATSRRPKGNLWEAGDILCT